MPIFSQDDEFSEIARAQELAMATQRAFSTANPQTAGNVSSLMRDFPWLPPGVAYPLAVQNITGAQAAEVAGFDLKSQVTKNPTKFQRNRRAQRRQKKDDGGGEGFLGMGVGPSVGPDLVPGSWNERKQARNKALGGNPENIIKPATRAAGLVANTAYQGVVGLARSSAAVTPEGTVVDHIGGSDYQAPEWAKEGPLAALKGVAAQTEGGQVVKSLIEGEEVDLGTGFLPSPDSPQAKRAAEAARNYSPQLYAGHAWTPGRAFAGYIFEPDTTAYTILSGAVDASVAWTADPTDIALKAVSAVNAGRKAFEVVPDAERLVREIDATTDVTRKVSLLEEAGAGMGSRPFIREKNPVHWWYGPDGSRVVDRVADTSSTYRIWKGFNGKIPVELADRLAKVSDPSEVRAILVGESGTTLTRIPQYRQGIAYNRWLEDVPDLMVDPQNVDGTVRNIERSLMNAKVAPEQIESLVNNYVGAYGRGERYAALKASFDTIKLQLLKNGVPEETATELTRMVNANLTEANKFWVSSMTGNNASVPLITSDGVMTVDGPMLSTERWNRPIMLPDAREVRRMVSALKPLYDTKGWRGAVGVGDAFMAIWKPMVLLRPALTVRVVGEEQVRLAVTGTGLFNHPLSYIAAILGDTSNESFVGKWLRGLGGDPLRDETISAFKNAGLDVPPELLNIRTTAEKAAQRLRDAGTFNKTLDAEDWTRVQGDQGLGDGVTKVFSEITGSKRLYLSEFTVLPRDSEHAGEALIGEIRRLGSDPDIGRTFTMSPDQMKAWGNTEVGMKWRQDLAAGRAETDAMARIGDDKMAWDSYVDQVFKRRDDFSRGDTDILEALRTQKIAGEAITDEFYNPAPGAIGWANTILGEGRGPDYIKAQKWLSKNVSQREEDLNVVKNAVSSLFNGLLTRPSNALNRSPDYRIKYWLEAQNLAPALSAKARAKLLDDLDKVNLPRLTKQNIRAAINNAPRNGTLTMEAADGILKKRALDHVQGLLYDLHKRNQTADVLRLIFPFGEAFKEIVTTWGRLIRENPQILRRGQQMMQAAREAQVDPMTGLPVASGGVGFFRWDEGIGAEVVTYPGSEFLNEALIGVPIPLTGPVQNMNMIGSGLPGVGPAVSIPAAYFLPDKPEFDGIRKIIFPFGEPEESLSWTTMFPAYAKKIEAILSGPGSDKSYATATMDVARYLTSTGEYDISGENGAAEISRLMNDAKEKAKWVYLVQAIAQSGAPASPLRNQLVEDKTGNLILLRKVTDAYYKKLEETGDPTETMDWFLDRFGADNLLATVATTETHVLGLSSTEEQYAWQRNNREQVDKFPAVWALFAPEGTTKDLSAHSAALKSGQRTPVNLQDAIRQANNKIARHIYENASETFADTGDGGEKYLRELRDELRHEYPGYGYAGGGYDTASLIAQVETAMEDPKLAKTQAGKGLALYLSDREFVIEQAAQRGLAWPSTSARAAPFRTYLAGSAASIAKRYPAFKRPYDLLLSREVD